MTETLPPGFSRESKIRIDREGHFWHEGERIEHQGLAQGFARWIARDANGRWILRNALDWCFITVDDVPLMITSASVDHAAGAVQLSISDGTQEPLRFETLRLLNDDALYTTVHETEIPARFSRAAAFALLDNVQMIGTAPMLVIGEHQHPLTSVESIQR